MIFSLFPKFLTHLSVPQLAAAVRGAGLDTTNLVIRDGFWVSRSNLAEDLPGFMKTIRAEGLDVRFATTGFSADEIIADPTPIALLAEHGIREFRMDYFRTAGDPRRELDNARRSMAGLATICRNYSVRAVYQVHHRMLFSSAWSAWNLVDGLPPDAVGVELDPGNQSFEGFEAWDKSVRLLGEYFVATGIKDSHVWRDPSAANTHAKGWLRTWCPIDEGVVNWHEFAAACVQTNFAGTLVFMPFYDPEDPTIQLAKLKREVAYLRNIFNDIREKTCPPTT